MTVLAESFLALRWKCPFCRKSWSSKARANAHVAQCWLDPSHRTCKTCVNHVPADHGGCDARPGCQCQDTPEYCDAGVDMTERVAYLDGPPGSVQYRTETRVQIDCALWEATS